MIYLIKRIILYFKPWEAFFQASDIDGIINAANKYVKIQGWTRVTFSMQKIKDNDYSGKVKGFK